MKYITFLVNLLKKPTFMGFIVFVILLFLHGVSSAQTPTVGEIAETLIEGTDFVTRFVLAACFIVGIGLIITGFLMYNAHRKNPKFVPLDRVVTYVILGAIVVAIPFLGHIFAPTSSTIDIKREQAAQYQYVHDIDAPLEIVKQ